MSWSNLISLAIGAIAGIWFGTGWVWWKLEPYLSSGYRFYRAATWFPCTVLPAFLWRWLP